MANKYPTVAITMPEELLSTIDINRGKEKRSPYIRFQVQMGLFYVGANNENSFSKGEAMKAADLKEYKAAAAKVGVVVNKKPNKKEVADKAPVLEVKAMAPGFFRILKGNAAAHKKVLNRLIDENKCATNF